MTTWQNTKGAGTASVKPTIEAGNWIAMTTSVFLFGGGQLLKGHWRGLAAVWVALTAVIALGTALARLGQPGSALFVAGRSLALVGASLVWALQLFDALLRPSRAA